MNEIKNRFLAYFDQLLSMTDWLANIPFLPSILYKSFKSNFILWRNWTDRLNRPSVCIVWHRKVEIGSLKGYFKRKREKNGKVENTCTQSITLCCSAQRRKKKTALHQISVSVIVYNIVDLWIDILISSSDEAAEQPCSTWFRHRDSFSLQFSMVFYYVLIFFLFRGCVCLGHWYNRMKTMPLAPVNKKVPPIIRVVMNILNNNNNDRREKKSSCFYFVNVVEAFA